MWGKFPGGPIVKGFPGASESGQRALDAAAHGLGYSGRAVRAVEKTSDARGPNNLPPPERALMGWSPRQAFGRLGRLLRDLLRQGLTPRKLALTVALGFFLGLNPLIGTTTLLCTLVALLFGLNLPLIQIVNYLVYPLEILMIIPFLELGAWFFGERLPPVDPKRLLAAFHNHFAHSLGVWGLVILRGLVAWVAVGGAMAAVVYWAGLPLIRRLVGRHDDAGGGGGAGGAG